MTDILAAIYDSQIVIADCTGRNPNVFYEIGWSHALGKDVVLLAQTADDIPFDVRHVRYFLYKNDAEGLDALASTLKSVTTKLGMGGAAKPT